MTVVPACYLWSSKRAHLLYLAAILCVCVWNGASYYIEVFSKVYLKQFDDASTKPPPLFQTDLLHNSITGAEERAELSADEGADAAALAAAAAEDAELSAEAEAAIHDASHEDSHEDDE